MARTKKTTNKTETSTDNTNTICKEIMNTQGVTTQKIAELLMAELVASGVTGKNEVSVLSRKIASVVVEQSDALINRVMKIAN